MASGLRVTRRRALGLVGRLGLGVGGAAAVGLLQTSHLRTAAGADDTDALEAPAVVTERRPYSARVEVRYATDHLRGPRGAAMSWGLERFAERRPNINVKVIVVFGRTAAYSLMRSLRPEPTPPPLSVYTGEARQIQRAIRHRDPEPMPHVALLSQDEFHRFGNLDSFFVINDLLDKHDGFVPADHYFIPDTYTTNDLDHSWPQPTLMTGRHFGLPLELSISGFLANASLAERAGVRLPNSENSWTWDDWTEWDARITDPETETFGTWARDDYAGQYMPQMYTNGLKKPFDDGLTRTMFEQPESLEAWTYLIHKVFERKTSPTASEARTLAGEHGDPFAAGKIGIWPTDRVSTTGDYIPRIKDRFRSTLLPEVVAPQGGPPGHSWSMRSNLVTVSAELEGSVEQAADFVVYLAGQEYQGRVGIERGNVPVNKRALDEPTSMETPPKGMQWLKVYADRPDNRGPYPFEGWEFWWRYHRELAGRAWSGRKSPGESLEACQAWGERYFRFYYDGPKPYVREPVYP